MMAAESRGVPTTLAVVAWLEGMAEETKATAGMRELPTTPIGKSFFGLKRDDIAEAMREVAPRVVDGITG